MRGHGVRRILPLCLLLVATVLAWSCTEVTTTAVGVASAEIQPSDVSIPVGQTTHLAVTLRDSVGNSIDRSVSWSSDDPTVASVDGSGTVLGVAPGQAHIRAEVGGTSAVALVHVQALPAIAVSATSVSFLATATRPAPAGQTVQVTNGGGGTLDGLSATISYGGGQPTGWLTASLSGTTAPVTLSLAAASSTLPAGTYTATVSLAAPGASNSPQTVSVTLTVTPLPLPAAPGGLTATAASASRIDLSWTDLSDNETSFVVERHAPGGSFAAVATLPAATVAYADTGLAASTAYTYRVKACGDAGCSAYSAEASATTLQPSSPPPPDEPPPDQPPPDQPTPPIAPRSLTAQAVAPDRVDLAWTDASSDETSFVVQRDDGAGFAQVASLGANVVAYSDTGLTPGKTYVYHVRSCNAQGCSGASNDVSATTPIPPAIHLDSTAVGFGARQGQGNPPSRAVRVTNTGGGTLSGLAASVAYGRGQPTGWLRATLSGATAPATLTLAATTGSLVAGTYTATVSVAATAASNSPQTVAVTFTVAPPPPPSPSIHLDSESASFTAIQGQGNPAAATVQVTNAGGGTLSGLSASVAYGSGQPTGWLAASLSGATAPATLTLTAATGSLAAGTYTATVSVASAAADNSPRRVAVTFTVTPPPAPIQLDAGTASFTAVQGGDASPATQVVHVTAAGGGTLDGLTATVSYASGQPTGWLAAALSGTSAPATVTLSATPGSLPAGSYAATVSVAAPGSPNSPQTVVVTLTVVPPPVIALDSGSISFEAVLGQGDPAAKTVQVTNSGGSTLTGLSASVAYASGDPGGWLTATLSGTTAPASLTLAAATGSLPAGSYSATVSIAAAGATNSPQTVSVSFTVVAPPSLHVDPNAASFTATTGRGDPPDATVQVTNAGGGTLSGLGTSVAYRTGEPGGWLTATLSGTTAPATLTLHATTAPLAVGTYTATVSVSAAGVEGSPQTIAVTFNVQSPAPPPASIHLDPTSASFDATQGQADPAAQTVQVTNAGGSPLDGLSADVAYGDGQPTGWLGASLSTTTTPATLTLTPTVGSLAPGTYSATVSVSSSSADNSPQQVAVTLTVAPPATPAAIGVTPLVVGFMAQADGDDPSAQIVEVTNIGGGTLTGMSAAVNYVGPVTGWLSASLASSTAPTTLTLSASVDTLPVGVYIAGVTVSAPGALDSAPVVVTLTILPAPPPPDSAPPHPDGLQGSAVSSMQVDLSWNDHADDETGFSVERKLGEGGHGEDRGWHGVGSTPTNVTAFSDTGVTGNSKYDYRVRACNAAGCSGPSNRISVRTP